MSEAISRIRVVIVGAGIGGLTCAIACRQQGIEVTVLERAAEFHFIGAGIQLPPNASRVMRQLEIYEKLEERGAVVVQGHTMRSYSSGQVLARKRAGQEMVQKYGSHWLVIHRAAYQKLLLEEAEKLGASIRTNSEVVGIESGLETTGVRLKDGQTIAGDVIIGADGLWSQTRSFVLGFESLPCETGDLAYRGTFSADQLRQIDSVSIQELLEASDVQVWLGPDKHVVFYPVNNHAQYNLVLLRPDNLPTNVRNEMGSLGEMRATFEGWDPSLTKMIAQLNDALKWKLCHLKELETWVNGSVALLGDSSHPTLPYQAQGAAMAVEDGVVVGTLLGRLQEIPEFMEQAKRKKAINQVLILYEKLRKERTTLNVKGAVQCQDFYHLQDGEQQIYRDHLLQDFDQSENWPEKCRWNWGDAQYQMSLLGFDVIAEACRLFDIWKDSDWA